MSAVSLLVILDGFGYREDSTDNAIAQANTPTWDQLWANRPHTLISGSGEDVGLPAGQMGNSEVGHMNLGAGGSFIKISAASTRPLNKASLPKTRQLTTPSIR